MEYWKIELWETSNGICRVDKDLLKQLRKKDKFIFASLEEKIYRYIESPIQNLFQKHLKKVKGEKYMWELKFYLPHKNQVRFLGCLILEKNVHTFYALYAFRKKDQKIRDEDIRIARSRIEEFFNENTKNELQKIL